jgi:hypothetical protein
LLDLALAVFDRQVRPDQYRYVETHAWWLGTFGPHQFLAEQRLRMWVPKRTERDWLLVREVTGGQQWLTGSAQQAVEDGFDLRDVAPVGRFAAPHGAFDTSAGYQDYDVDLDLDRDLRFDAQCASPGPPPRGSWKSPTPQFFSRLPLDPQRLLDQLVDDNPGTWFGPFAAAVTALRTGLVPAPLRSALYKALTGLPAVTVGRAVNLDGRDCLALVHDAGPTRSELMVDPCDGRFVGERDTVRADSRAGLSAGTVVSTTAVRTGVVDGPGLRPEASTA